MIAASAPASLGPASRAAVPAVPIRPWWSASCGRWPAKIDGMELPAIEKISESQREDPFQILIGTLLSARTQDATTLAASTRLFKRARTPRTRGRAASAGDRAADLPGELLPQQGAAREGGLPAAARRLRRAACPSSLDELVTLPGVGRKTATLVMILAFQSRRHICVDTHVHRISNRLGWVRTTDARSRPSRRSMRATDARWWPYINLYLVTWGQNTCRPVYPRCGDCAIAADCPRLGVTRVGQPRKGES